MKKKITDFLLMTAGTLLIVVGIYFFKFPNNFSTGGVSGLSVILAKLFDLTPSTYSLIINLALLFVGFVFVGSDFGMKTVYCSFLQAGLTFALQYIYPLRQPLTQQPFLELIIAIFLTAAGSAILFNVDASAGGTDIIAMIIKRNSSLNISTALFVADCAIVCSTFFLFPMETSLFCVVGFLSKVLFVNTLLESINLSKCCTIIVKPEDEQPICDFITHTLNRSATVSRSYKGAYNEDDKTVIILVLTRHQTIQLKKFVKELDPKAFIVITNTSEICGKGFREAV